MTYHPQAMKRWAAIGSVVLLATVALAGCWDDGGDSTVAAPVDTTVVPASAGASVAAFVAYESSLSAAETTGEPLTIDTSFVAPTDDTAEPTPLT